MKKHLLVAASALVVGLSFGSYAFAGNDGGDGGNHGNKPTTDTSTAVAASVQAGSVEDNFAVGTAGANAIGTAGGTGLFNVQQNNGANSLIQSDNTLGAILNCSCSSSPNSNVTNTSLALSAQVAEVEGNVSIGAENKSSSGSSSSSANIQASSEDKGGGHHDVYGGGGGHDDTSFFSGDFSHSDEWMRSSEAVASANAIGTISGTGLMNISQNNGNNSLLQSSNTVAAIVGK